MLALSFVLGFALGGIYDLLRSPVRTKRLAPSCLADRLEKRLVFPSKCRRPDKKHSGKGLSFIVDIIFCLVTSLALLLLLYMANSGQFRLSSLAVLSIGFFIYRITFHKPVCLLLDALFILWRVALAWTKFAVLFPFRWIISRLSAPIASIRQRVKQMLLQRFQKAEQSRISNQPSPRPPKPQHNGKHYFGTKSNRI